MKFKQFYLKEFETKSVAELAFNVIGGRLAPYIPLTTKMIQRLTGKKFRRRQVWHVTDIEHLKQTIKLEGSRKQISSFSDIESPDIFDSSELLTEMQVVFLMDADIILASPEDFYTDTDSSGRRWAQVNDLIKSARSISPELASDIIKSLKKLDKDIVRVAKKLLKKYKVKQPQDLDWGHKNLTFTSEKERQKTKGKIIKDYMNEVEKVLDKNHEYVFDIFEMLSQAKVKQVGKFNREEWDEIIVNNFKIKKIYLLWNQMSSSDISYIKSWKEVQKYPIESVADHTMYNKIKKMSKAWRTKYK